MLHKSITDLLNDRQENLFVWIYNECISNHKVTKSNQQISNETEIPVSTIEKYLKKFEELGLIERGSQRIFDSKSGRWETLSREIILNAEVFDPFSIAKLRKQRIDEALKMIENPRMTMKIIQKIKQERAKNAH